MMHIPIKTLVSYLAAILLSTGQLFSQDIPEPMSPPRLVNDFASFLDQQEVSNLEAKLRQFHAETSTQIYIVTISDLNGYAPGDYAARLGEKWGIGQQGKDNGIVILVKPKTAESRGEVYISTGYGLEGAVPDIIANRITDYEIIPSFQNGNFAEGLNKGADVLISLTREEFTAEEYRAQTENTNGGGGPGIVGIIILILIFSALFGGKSRMGRHQGVGRSLPFWLLLGMMNSGGRSHGGSFGDFSGGRGGFGGFGGGFGGGGGGSFGGGGAGGSW